MRADIFSEFEFFTGVPDSQLKPLCNYLMSEYGIGKEHIIAANEGNCVALAAGYHLATGKVPVVYLQNSGIGNIINPVASLLNDKVYGIPCVFVVGWRGEPGIHDEPQHIYQGEVTVKLLEDMDISTFVVSKDTTEEQVREKLVEFRALLSRGKQVAFVIRKGALEFDGKVKYSNDCSMCREDIIRHIAEYTGDGVIVSTTGKASRELFEIREARGEGHEKDFLTVGSMGHASSIALEIALSKPERKVWCVDGDGAALMHMGAMALVGSNKPSNMVHILINNSAHETVGGMPTVGGDVDFTLIAKGCGYPCVVSVDDFEALDEALSEACQAQELTFIEVKCSIGARDDLGRPTTTAMDNKKNFMKYLGN
ncbi:MAG: phosphonopyruvate decarboxylase [Ruminococcus sp.]|nr:phosphonopyruvate decarboxylase [Ruminococcus sp.]